ncbi:hypothetical protein STEG23_015720 [Scotinomys teguina]
MLTHEKLLTLIDTFTEWMYFLLCGTAIVVCQMKVLVAEKKGDPDSSQILQEVTTEEDHPPPCSTGFGPVPVVLPPQVSVPVPAAFSPQALVPRPVAPSAEEWGKITLEACKLVPGPNGEQKVDPVIIDMSFQTRRPNLNENTAEARITFVVPTALNPATLLPDPDLEAPLHECSGILAQAHCTQLHLRNTPLPDAEKTWFSDESSYVRNGTRLIYHAEDELLDKIRNLHIRTRRKPVTALIISILLGASLIGMGTGNASLITQNEHYSKLQEVIDPDVETGNIHLSFTGISDFLSRSS